MPSETIETADTLLERLARFGERLPPEVRRDIVQRGPAVVPELISIVESDELGFEEALGAGWLPIHAAELLLDLKAETAVPALLSALVRSHWEEILHSKISVRLPELGSVVFDPAAALMETLTDEDSRSALCSILARLGVRDERVFTWCRENFDREPVLGAIDFGYYGDERALPLLTQAIEEFGPDWESPFGLMNIREFVDAYERIAGTLPERLRRHVESLEREWSEHQEIIEHEQPIVVPPKVGRNEPCPCGSGKKFKKCCGV